MRKRIGFAVAAVIIALALLLIRTSVVATHADTDRPKGVGSPYIVTSNPYLPIQVLEQAY